MNIFDHIDPRGSIKDIQEGRILSGAIYEIYKEADQKREELLKTVDSTVAQHALPSYKDLRKFLFTHK